MIFFVHVNHSRSSSSSSSLEPPKKKVRETPTTVASAGELTVQDSASLNELIDILKFFFQSLSANQYCALIHRTPLLRTEQGIRHYDMGELHSCEVMSSICNLNVELLLLMFKCSESAGQVEQMTFEEINHQMHSELKSIVPIYLHGMDSTIMSRGTLRALLDSRPQDSDPNTLTVNVAHARLLYKEAGAGAGADTYHLLEYHRFLIVHDGRFGTVLMSYAQLFDLRTFLLCSSEKTPFDIVRTRGGGQIFELETIAADYDQMIGCRTVEDCYAQWKIHFGLDRSTHPQAMKGKPPSIPPFVHTEDGRIFFQIGTRMASLTKNTRQRLRGETCPRMARTCPCTREQQIARPAAVRIAPTQADAAASTEDDPDIAEALDFLASLVGDWCYEPPNGE